MALCTSASSLLWALAIATILLLHSVESRKLPSFMPKCSAKLPIPELEKCALEASRVSVPKMVHGIEGQRFPDLDPLTVPEIRIQTGTSASNLDMTVKNIILRGLANTNVLHFGIENRIHYALTCSIPRLEVESDYEVDGKILVLPIKGKGKANFTFENAIMYYEQPYTLERRNGHVYFKFTSSNAKFNCSRAYFNLDNLFNGDKMLGDNVNNFLNENWKEVVDDILQPFVDAAAAIIRQFSLGILGNVPYEEIFNDVDETMLGSI